MSEFTQFPPQQLSFSRKNKAWRKKHCDWADSKSLFNYSLVRKSVIHKKINYDLLNGKLHMDDLMLVMVIKLKVLMPLKLSMLMVGTY